MKRQLQCKELLLEDDAEIDLISLVKRPAIEVDFLAFSAEQIPVLFSEDDRMVVTGPALIPNKMIYRKHPVTGEEFNAFFSEETVLKISEQYLSKFKQANVNIEHGGAVGDICLSESWLVSDPSNDKSNAMGFKDLPRGTWMVSMKVNNLEVWSMVKSGEVAGFSIEGTLAMRMSDLVADAPVYDEMEEAEMIIDELKRLLACIK